MTLQSEVFLVWAALSCAAVAVFYGVYRRSRRSPATITYQIINRRRFQLFFLLIAALLLVFLVALSAAPYATSGNPDEIIGVTARMFSFDLTKDTVECGKLIEFRVNAVDVTHGFGVYTAEGNLVGQVQAMPGYINRVRMRFERPGRYTILCLEYCGGLHHQMRTSIIAR
jgi:cytochrome c oxidase subunit II